jgi:hypothetical protein
MELDFIIYSIAYLEGLMGNYMHKVIDRLKSVSRPIFLFIVVISYIFFTAVSMGPGISKCTDTVSGLGDSTGGPIWRASIKPDQPLLGGYTKVTNFPTGEDLYSPVGYAAFLQTVIMKTATKVVGPVCAYNTINIVGYLSTALTMFAFVYFLLKSRWIAWLSGYAVAFTPYAQSKVGGHPSYGYASLLIALLWLLLLVFKHRKWIHGLALGVVLAVCCYFDPYFILFAGTIVGPAVFVWLGYALVDARVDKTKIVQLRQTLKVLMFSFASLLILISPLVYVRVKDAAVIGAATGAVRGNIMAAAMLCSNYPSDYLLPDPYNLTLNSVFGADFTAKDISFRHWCGPGESRVSISLTILSLIVIAAFVMYKRRRRLDSQKLQDSINYDFKVLVTILMAIGLTAVLLALPPRIFGIPMPSAFVIYITKTWRIFAREYLVINMIVVILFAISLKYLATISKNKYKIASKIIFVLIFGLIFKEYQYHDSFRPFTFSYQRDVPKIYQRIKEDSDIKAIAEYPLDRLGIESDVIVYYTTMQSVHQKSILNSATMNNINEKLHISIKDLSDPQTIPVLRALGITNVTIHGTSASQVLQKTDQLEILSEETPPVYGLTLLRSAPTNTVVLAKIKEGPKADYAVTIQEGFAVNMSVMKSPTDMQYETLPDPVLGVTSLNGIADRSGLYDVCFDVKMAADNDSSDMVIVINGIIKKQLKVSDSYSRIALKASKNDRIIVDNLINHNTRIDNLGCRPGEIVN